MNTGSQTFALSTNLAGATVISISSHGSVVTILSGHLTIQDTLLFRTLYSTIRWCPE